MGSVKFLYRCRKPNSIVDIWTCCCSIAEELSNQGCFVTCRGIDKVKWYTKPKPLYTNNGIPYMVK